MQDVRIGNMTTVWTDQSEATVVGGPFYLKIDAIHYLLIDNGNVNRLLISPATGSLWVDQQES